MLNLEAVILSLLLVWTVVLVWLVWRLTNSKGSFTWTSQTTAPEPDNQAITFSTQEIQDAIRAQVSERVKNGEKI
jgi:regulatory protein YycH of two-component signal transduction system YycFG